MKRIFFIVLLIFPVLGLQAQMNTAHWYFGANAGVDFSSGSPVPVPGGALSTAEGSSSISDEFGELKFYTDGVTVYTQSHGVMPNGEGLYGKSSSSQSALIVPGPGPSQLFYIFTTDAVEMSPKYGLRYTVVDMALGTEGEVLPAQKNIPVPLGGLQGVSEKLAAVAKADCSGYWIITYYKNKFYTFSLTADGLDIDNPIVSEAAPFSDEDGIQGYIKVSPDGNKLAAAFKKDYTGSLILYDLNSNDGSISGGAVLSAPDTPGGRLYYGVEFSPDSNVLYATYSGLVRYDLTAASIPGSEVIMYTTGNGVSGALQTGLDGKIYYARLNSAYYLAVINDPNNFDAPGFNAFGLFLNGQSHAIGLPAFPQPFYNASLFINGSKDVQTFCAEDPINFTYCFNGGVLPDWTVKYDFGDGTISTDEAPVHTYAEAGTYTVTLEITIGLNIITVSTTVIILPLPVANEPTNMVVCDVLPNDGFSEFNLDLQKAAILGVQDPDEYTVTYHLTEEEAINNEGTQPFDLTNTASPQTIYVRVTNNTTGCFDTTSFDLIVHPLPVTGDPDNLLACEEQEGTGIAEFDLTEAIPQIIGDNTDMQVTFYKDFTDLNNNFPIVGATAYANVTPYSDTIIFKAYEAAAPDCISTGELGLEVSPLLIVSHAITDYLLCDVNAAGDGIEVFDLTLKNDEITTSIGAIITYYTSQSHAEEGEEDIDAPTAYESGNTTIWVRVANGFGCQNITSFELVVNPLPVVNTDMEPFYACEEEPGQGLFDLDQIDTVVTNGASGYTVAYFATLDAAQNPTDNNYLPTPYLSPNTTIYARVENVNTECV
ncbi:MAG: PKD domain-containing protein, partial [Flavobacterium sp.]